ncbi:type VI secretion system-associated protein TagF [Acidiphilium sp.]|uniref:type VI secretion system-associated protein TagF n=1 Tax=Acidiphilium sp. TaxID=527 RepID=UPI003D0716D7
MSAGFYGKLPSRGDFIGGGLASFVVDALDQWMRACLVASQAALGSAWIDCWMEAPVWRFFSVIGTTRFGGVWMPSMDKVERCFPLVIAIEAEQAGPGWFDAAEAAGFDAVTGAAMGEMTPDHLALRLRAIAPDAWTPPAAGVWWTAGAPRREAGQVACEGLPDPAIFAGFLSDRGTAP